MTCSWRSTFRLFDICAGIRYILPTIGGYMSVWRVSSAGEKLPAQVKSITQCDSEKLQHLGSSAVAKAKWSNLSTPVLGSRAEGHCRLWTTFDLAESMETLDCKILPVICFGWHSAIGWLHIHKKWNLIFYSYFASLFHMYHKLS